MKVSIQYILSFKAILCMQCGQIIWLKMANEYLGKYTGNVTREKSCPKLWKVEKQPQFHKHTLI